MAEIESKDPELDSETGLEDDVNKENVIPIGTIEDEEKSSAPVPEASEEEKDVIVTASKPDSKSETKPLPVDDLSIYTEDKLYEDIQSLIKSKILDLKNDGERQIRKALAVKYGSETDRKGKMFKKHDPFKRAIGRIVSELTTEPNSGDEDTGKKEKDKSDKLKKRMSRKRKQPSTDNEEGDEDEDEINDSDPPTKKRRTNDGGAVVDDDEAQSDDSEATKKKKRKQRKKRKKQERKERKRREREQREEESEDDQEEEEEERQTAKKKKSKEPHEATLTKLKRLARAAGLANPKMYGELKSVESNKKRVEFLKKLLTDNDVPITMNEKQIKKIQEDYALKREMADLGIGIGTGNPSEFEDGVPLSCRRPKRTRKAVNYKTPKYNADGSEEEEGDENEEEDDGEEYKEDESEESDVYQPSDVEVEEYDE